MCGTPTIHHGKNEITRVANPISHQEAAIGQASLGDQSCITSIHICLPCTHTLGLLLGKRSVLPGCALTIHFSRGVATTKGAECVGGTCYPCLAAPTGFAANSGQVLYQKVDQAVYHFYLRRIPRGESGAAEGTQPAFLSHMIEPLLDEVCIFITRPQRLFHFPCQKHATVCHELNGNPALQTKK